MKKWNHFIHQPMSWLGCVFILVLWQIAGVYQLLPKYVLPTPIAIISALVRDRALLLEHGFYTLKTALLGLFLGVVLASLLALIMDRFNWIREMVYPILVVIQTIPTIALAPILVLWLGYGILPKLVLIVLTTIFPIIISILDGFRQCDRDTLRLFELMGAKPWQVLWHFKIPNALPYFYAGLRVSVSYAFVTTVVSEWLGGFEGLGVYMIQSKKLFQYDTMFAIIVLISIISLVGMKLVQISEKHILKWRPKN